MRGLDCVEDRLDLGEHASREEEVRGFTGRDVDSCLGADAAGAGAGDEDWGELADQGLSCWRR
jgi:hypothetical protein